MNSDPQSHQPVRESVRQVRTPRTDRWLAECPGIAGVRSVAAMAGVDEARMWARSVLRGQALEISEATFEETRGRVLRMMQQVMPIQHPTHCQFKRAVRSLISPNMKRKSKLSSPKMLHAA